MTHRTYREEFPDFDPATMPSIPADWADTSWHNDACPSFETAAGLRVFVDFADPAERELAEMGRFLVLADDGERTIYEGDNWEAALATVAAGAAQ